MNTEAQRTLPELGSARIDELEDALFADIARERRRGRTRRTRIWMGAGAAAAVIVVAAVIAPGLSGIVGMSASDESAVAPDIGVAPDAPQSDGAGIAGEDSSGGADDATGVSDTAGSRDIITSASATLIVADVAASARMVGNAAVAHGGYVESMSVGTSGAAEYLESDGGVVYDTMPYPYTPDGAWVNVRVPADELTDLVDELSGVGEVTASSVNRQDVTEQTIDLEARIAAAQASVDRLTELMTEAGDLSDLIAAEAALSERQAMLESYQQQLESLESLVAMSSLSVTLVPEVEAVEADPAGFGDGWTAGWNSVVATLNGIVIALGFALPWLAVVGVLGFLVWLIIRLVRRPRPAPSAKDDGEVSTGRSPRE